MLHRILPALIGAALAVNWAPASAAAPSLIGTLKCTAEVAKAGPTGGETALRDWKVDCAFEPVKGQVQHYAGAINDPGTAPRELGKAFLVWNVLAMAPEVRSGHAGRHLQGGQEGRGGGPCGRSRRGHPVAAAGGTQSEGRHQRRAACERHQAPAAQGVESVRMPAAA